MAEIYTGTKFTSIRLSNSVLSSSKTQLLISWGVQFGMKGLAPKTESGHAGNLSVRTKNGFLITGAGQSLEGLDQNAVSEVVSFFINTKKVLFHGIPEPSSEAFMHGLIYQDRPDVNAIFHGHNDTLTRFASRLGYPETQKEVPYGTIEGAEMVRDILRSEEFCIIKKHGFVSLGATADFAGEAVLEVLAKLKTVTP